MRQLQVIQNLVNELSRLPSIGRKTAQRLAYHIVDIPSSEAMQLAQSIVEVKKKVKYCNKCFGLSETDICEICEDSSRDRSKICVVENVRDYWAIENTSVYNGLYHVLHGAISPIDGVDVEDIKLKELLQRLIDDDIKEIIIATSPTVPGEATALYISKILKSTPDIVVTRIAKGIPIGGELEYADEVTLARSIEGRNTIERASTQDRV